MEVVEGNTIVIAQHRQLMLPSSPWHSGPTPHCRRRWHVEVEPFDKCRAAPQVVWLSAGGRGLWRLFEERRTLSGMLDLYHAAQNL